MEPTIKAGEYVLATPLASDAAIARGELVVFKYPLQPQTIFAKRVIAIPGDTIEIRHKRAFVNRGRIAEPYAVHTDPEEYDQAGLPEPYKSRDNFGPYAVPRGEYFVLGDNRDRSSDSRYWGTVRRDFIVGRVVFIGPAAGPFRSIE